MPVAGLPVILDASLNSLMLNSSILSYKIFRNDNGTSSVIINFADILHSSREAPCYPPRFSHSNHKPASRRKRDKERRDHFFSTKSNTNNVLSTPYQRKPKCDRIKRTNQDSVSAQASSLVSQTCGDVVSSKMTSCVQDSDSTSSESEDYSSSVTNETVNSDHVVNASQNRLRNMTDQNEPVVYKSTAESGKSSATASKFSTHPRKHNVNRDDSAIADCAASIEFNSDDDIITAADWKQNMTCEMKQKISDYKRNKDLIRVAIPTTTPDGGPTLIAEIDDLFVTFYPKSKTVGSIYIFQDSDTETMTGQDRVQYNSYYRLPEYKIKDTSPEFDDLNSAILAVLQYLRD